MLGTNGLSTPAAKSGNGTTLTNGHGPLRTIYFSDTSLRDGEQAPGVNFSLDKKVAIARELSKMGIDEIDASFPVSSASSFEACQRIAREVGPLMEGRQHIGKPVMVTALTRPIEYDIDRTYEAIKDAPRFAIRLFIATSDIHLEHKLRITREKCLEMIDHGTRYALRYTPHVTLCSEDSARSDPEFLCRAFQTAIDAGADTVYLSDTVGSCIPAEFYRIVKYCVDHTTHDPQRVRWGVHTHNDLGLGVANILAGIEA
ncbi:2-isopropylmalate synthase (Alpha-isopropylmalate synthase) (Alpha-IPM synthetase), partial [Tieghemiomyces parasiticus]